MQTFEIALLLFLVVDPFGNLPLVLALLRGLDDRRYRQVVLRETALAFAVLFAGALFGAALLRALAIEQPALQVAGGVILFLISLKMVFGRATEIFSDSDRYGNDPLLVPIAVPTIAGPAALTTVMVLQGQQHVPLALLSAAMMLVFVLTLATLMAGRPIAHRMGERGLNAAEKFMGLLLNLVSVNMIMVGTRAFFTG